MHCFIKNATFLFPSFPLNVNLTLLNVLWERGVNYGLKTTLSHLYFILNNITKIYLRILRVRVRLL